MLRLAQILLPGHYIGQTNLMMVTILAGEDHECYLERHSKHSVVFFVMDDNNDRNSIIHNIIILNVALNRIYKSTRNGLGLEVKVRGMQWQQFLAQDVLWFAGSNQYQHNDGTKYLVCSWVLMLGLLKRQVGPKSMTMTGLLMSNDITYTGDYGNSVDRNPRWVGDVGMVGYLF